MPVYTPGVHPTPPSAALLAAIPGVSTRLATILAALAALVARAFLKHPVHVVHIVPLWNYIGRTARRFTRTLDRLAQGKLRPHSPRAGRQQPANPKPRKPRGFPTTHAWLRATLVQEANALGSQLTHLLNEPETLALLQAAPQAARLLRPICHMLGIQPEAIRRLPAPKPPAKPEPRPRAEPEPAALAPLPPQPLCPRLRLRWPWNALPA